ncbi:hypothetical protein C8R44DRAFT_530955, partial [Mycena epipterygia]
PVVISNIAIFATCTAHWIINVERFFLAFLGSTEHALQFYRDESHPTSVANNTLVIVVKLIGDAVIIHRLWLVWNRDLHVVFVPLLSWLGVLTSGIAVPYLFTQSTPRNNRLLTLAGHWLTANWALTALCATNPIQNSAFIAWRIWKTSRVTAEVGGGLLMPVFVILIESAAVWTTWTIFFAATFLTGSMLELIVRDLTPLIIGIVNLLIHLRVGLGWSHA